MRGLRINYKSGEIVKLLEKDGYVEFVLQSFIKKLNDYEETWIGYYYDDKTKMPFKRTFSYYGQSDSLDEIENKNSKCFSL